MCPKPWWKSSSIARRTPDGYRRHRIELVREKNLSLDLVVETIEAALLVAYQRTDGSAENARVQLDRKSGHVTVWAGEVNDEGEVIGEFDDTPEGFGRIAAATARQVLLSRLREAEGDATMTEFSGKEGDLVSGAFSNRPTRG